MKYLIALAVLVAAGQAQAINKCTDPTGAVVYQDAPCAGKGVTINPKPASGPSSAAPVSAAAQTNDGGGPKSEAARLEANIAKSQKERRLRELQEHEVPRAESMITRHAEACKAEQAAFESRKGRYVQNLYGKTDAAQTASEQAAAAARCDTKDRELREAAMRIKGQCIALGGCT